MGFKDTHFSSDRVLSISAIIIALVSIFVAVWEGLETRKHYRFSVQPQLELSYSSDLNYFGYVLLNNGLGPSIITGSKIFVDGEEINYSGFSGIDDFLIKLDLKDRYAGHETINIGKVLKAGSEIKIMFFKFHETDNRESLVQQIYQRAAFEIEYESMYGEKFKCSFPKNEGGR